MTKRHFLHLVAPGVVAGLMAILGPTGSALAGETIIASDPIFESFERGLGPWTPHAFVEQQFGCTPNCLDVLNPTVEITDDFAHDGAHAVSISAEGFLDDGTVWIQRAVDLPAGTHDLGVAFQLLWPYPNADIGTWEIVAYIGTEPADEESDFTILGLTGVSGWTPHSYSATVTLARPGVAHVAIGINVVFENSLTHGFDSVTITGVPTPAPNPDLNGDGHVNGLDLAMLLAQWSGAGMYTPCPPFKPADLSQDCRVNGLDLATLLAAWS